jgi:hypothetical protein
MAKSVTVAMKASVGERGVVVAIGMKAVTLSPRAAVELARELARDAELADPSVSARPAADADWAAIEGAAVRAVARSMAGALACHSPAQWPALLRDWQRDGRSRHLRIVPTAGA